LRIVRGANPGELDAPAFVRAWVKIRLYSDGTLSFTGTDASAATTRKDTKEAASIRSAVTLWKCEQRRRTARVPQAEQKQKQRSVDALPKLDNFAIDSPCRKRVMV